MTNKFTWTEIYSEFAHELLKYRNRRPELIEMMKSIFEASGANFYISDGKGLPLTDICPFTVFGTFNRGISDDKRIKLLEDIKKEFQLTSALPVDFDGIPILNNINSMFFRYKVDQGIGDIDRLWNMFECALNYADRSNNETRSEFCKAYDALGSQKGVSWNLTMALYWIAPFEFINLDQRNRSSISTVNETFFGGKLPNLKLMPDGETYLNIVDAFKEKFSDSGFGSKSFPEFSYGAWQLTKEVSPHDLVSKASFLKWFEPLIDALRTLGGAATPSDVREQIAKDLNLSEEVLNERRGKSQTKKFDNELAFARNYLLYEGLIDKSERGIWALTEAGKEVEMNIHMASEIFKRGVVNQKEKNESEGSSISVGATVKNERKYWLYAPGEQSYKWDEFHENGVMGIGWDYLGDLNGYSDKESIREHIRKQEGGSGSYKNAVLAAWQFAKSINIGDIIFVKRGRKKLIGCGVVTSDYVYDSNRDEYQHIRQVDWTHNGEWDHPGNAAMKTLTDVTDYTEYVEEIVALMDIEESEDGDDESIRYEAYLEEDFLSDVFMDTDQYQILKHLLKSRKNIILQGPPGVGKTYAAKRLAYSLMEEKDPSRVMMVQFHQSYSYEDFIIGFRPSESGFELAKGPFYSFCKDAAEDDGRDYFFIIDEINRGNLSKIFGELLMLIESDKRNEHLRLLYSNERFTVPKNVHIIGMMNTADRGLAMIDYALRRRFAFYDMEPAFESDGFKALVVVAGNDKLEKLVTVVQQLNEAIEQDESLGGGFKIGHSFLCANEDVNDTWLQSVVRYELIPLINEYWFDEPDKVMHWQNRLLGAIND